MRLPNKLKSYTVQKHQGKCSRHMRGKLSFLPGEISQTCGSFFQKQEHWAVLPYQDLITRYSHRSVRMLFSLWAFTENCFRVMQGFFFPPANKICDLFADIKHVA